MVLKVQVNNKEVRLTSNQYLAQGGEGTVYKKGNTAYKIYHKNTIQKTKIKELSLLSDPRILKPKELIYKENKVVGYTMDYVKDTYPLCQVFTKSFQKRHNLDNIQLLNIFKQMIEIISHIHSQNILIVDLNEYNILISKDFKKVYFIDVDSYQTKKYPATAIMEHVQDPHNKTFSFMTDYYSLAILSFQLLIGIHPFKGKYTQKINLLERMKSNISVFNKDVKIPKLCNDLQSLPEELYYWFFNMFEKSERTPPPDSFGVMTKRMTKKLSSNALNIIKSEIDVLDYVKIDNFKIIKKKNYYNINGFNYYYKNYGFTNNKNIFFLEDDRVIFNKKEYEVKFDYERIIQDEEALYLINNDTLFYLEVTEFGNKVLISIKKIANLLSNYQIFEGAIVYELWGKKYLIKLNKKGSNAIELNIKKDTIIDLKLMNNKVIYSLGKSNVVKIEEIVNNKINLIREFKSENLSVNLIEINNFLMTVNDDKIILFNRVSEKIIKHPFHNINLKYYNGSVFVIDEDLYKISLS